jgi:hypothetical protein
MSRKYFIQAQHRTSEFRGDHSADIAVAIDCHESTTVGDLINNYLLGERRTDGGWISGVRDSDWIEIRVGKKNE